MNRRHLLAALPAVVFPLHRAGAGEAGFSVSATAALAAYQAYVEQYLSSVLATLKIVAESQEARSGKWDVVKPLITGVAVDVPAQAAVWYALPDGSYSTAEKGASGESLKDRDYFPALMSGKTVLGSLVVSKSTGHRSVIVAAPVTEGAITIAAVGASVRARLLSRLVEEATAMPPDLILYTLDPAGRTVLHRDPDKMFEYPSEQGDPGLRNAVTEMLSHPFGSLTYSYGGKERDAVFSASRLTGWKFVLVKVRG